MGGAGAPTKRGLQSITMSAPAAVVPRAGLQLHHSWIGRAAVTGRAGSRPAVDPSDGLPFAEVSLLDREQAGQALEVAGRAFPAWSALSFPARAEHLLNLREAVFQDADALAALIAREQGKTAAEAHSVEIAPALEALAHLARHAEDDLRDEDAPPDVLLLAHKEARIVYEPWGVVLVITPWNYPFGISMIGAATALAAGNTVVLKPAPSTTLVGLRIAELATRAGLPDGVLSALAVDDGVAASLVADPRVAKIVFTGSVGTGRKIMAAAAENLTPVLLELGGKDPAVVAEDADIARAARGIVWGAFANAGQTCASVERVYVERAVADRFVALVVAETKRLRLATPGSTEAEIGPMSLERQRLLVEEHVADAEARGATILVGGRRPEGPGFFYPPTVLANVDHSMKVMREETFGPLLPIMAVDSLDEAIRLANESEYGLTASGWTRDPLIAARLERELKAGVVTINDCVSSFGEPTAPWGGYRKSGIGRTHGRVGLREMAQVKYVSRESSRRLAAWWYPYDAQFAQLIAAYRRAFHARSALVRIANQMKMLTFPRFWRRGHLGALFRNTSKLF
jgi:acyl-CoA reductase-like NAD-dependent aldehyde dehydrogenase